MGQKVNPYGFRLGHHHRLEVAWFADPWTTVDYLIEDWKIRDYLMTSCPNAAISRIEVERTRDRLRVDVTPPVRHRDRPPRFRGRRRRARPHQI